MIEGWIGDQWNTAPSTGWYGTPSDDRRRTSRSGWEGVSFHDWISFVIGKNKWRIHCSDTGEIALIRDGLRWFYRWNMRKSESVWNPPDMFPHKRLRQTRERWPIVTKCILLHFLHFYGLHMRSLNFKWNSCMNASSAASALLLSPSFCSPGDCFLAPPPFLCQKCQL